MVFLILVAFSFFLPGGIGLWLLLRGHGGEKRKKGQRSNLRVLGWVLIGMSVLVLLFAFILLNLTLTLEVVP